MDMFNLNGKEAVVTGGAGGIGLSCAKALAEAGCRVCLVDKDKVLLDSAVNDCKALGYDVSCFPCDISDLDSVIKLAEFIKTNGGIDILINCAAINNRKAILSMSLEEWDSVIKINLAGAFNIGKTIGQLMVDQGRGGKIIFVVSTGAFRASINYGAYSASKAGVVMLMKTLALELAPYSILCNAIAPTATETNFTYQYYKDNPGTKERVALNHPLGRIAQPEDYQGAALFLSSAASDFVTGTVLVVDGGKTAK